MREQPVVLVPRVRQEQRWPAYIPLAVGLGVRAQMGVRLFLRGNGSMGSLNLYSVDEEDIHPDAENIADLFAAHAALALMRTRQAEHLNEALHSRKVIAPAAAAGPDRLARLPHQRRLLVPHPAELAVGVPRGGIDGRAVRPSAPARLTREQARGRAARQHRHRGLTGQDCCAATRVREAPTRRTRTRGR